MRATQWPGVSSRSEGDLRQTPGAKNALFGIDRKTVVRFGPQTEIRLTHAAKIVNRCEASRAAAFREAPERGEMAA